MCVCVCVCGCSLTPGGHGVALLQLPEVPEPRVLDDDGARLQRVLPHRVLALVPDLERPVVALHRLVHIDVVQLRATPQEVERNLVLGPVHTGEKNLSKMVGYLPEVIILMQNF